MANKKITDLVEITSAANVDVLPIVDVSVDITNKIKVENLPISTATQTALDAKQETLVSGTNIKTINSTSILGSGDVAVQPTLVSGTNIKTINSTSLLGSGDISIAANPAGSNGQIQFNDSSAFGADSNLFWDNTNKRLGIGTSSPASPISISNTGGNMLSYSRIAGASGAIAITNIRTGGSQGTVFDAGSFSFRSGSTNYLVSESFRLGVGTNNDALTSQLQVKGSGSTSATTSLLVQNSSGTDMWTFRDDGTIIVPGTTSIGYSNGSRQVVWNYSGGGVSGGMKVQGFGGVSLASFDGSAYVDAFTMTGNGNQRIGIGTTSPNASAKLDVTSTTQGFLPPRMTTTQKNAISTPASGLIVYDTDTNKLCCYNGTSWNDLF